MSEVLIVRTGTANLASVQAAFERLGAAARMGTEAAAVRDAVAVVLPGVGAFAAALPALEADGLGEALRERIAAGRPTLAVCLGLQLLAEGSEESPGQSGLGVLRGVARRFPETVRVPQLGWNQVRCEAGDGMLGDGAAYFANSYRLIESTPGWRAAWSDHGGEFIAAIERGAVLACQFHPELSGRWGKALLERWWSRAQERVPC